MTDQVSERFQKLEQQFAKLFGKNQQSERVNSGFKQQLQKITVPSSMFKDFYVNMKNKLIIIPIILFIMFYYFKPPQIMVTKNKVKTIDYKLFFKYLSIITVILYICLFYYFYKYR